MNKYTLIKIALIAITIGTLVMVTMTSCRTIRPGCPDTWGKVGYASNNISKPLNHAR
jgi:hypothetical protein